MDEQRLAPLDTERAIRAAAARASNLRAHIRAGRTPDAVQLAWLADVACAALLLIDVPALDTVAWLAVSDDQAAPDWLKRQQEDWDARR
jgi:hypothetical protein